MNPDYLDILQKEIDRDEEQFRLNIEYLSKLTQMEAK